MKPRLSVVVPFYGVENYIEDCLRSIQQQRLEDIEVVMVDDGSPDGSRAIAERFVETDPRFRLVTQENAGLGPARNTGVRHADAEYLTFVDSDDLVTRSGFTRMVGSLDESGSSFCGGNARRFNNTRGVKPSWAHTRPFARTLRASHVYEVPDLARDRMVWNKVYRRDFWDEYGFEFPPIRYEDYPVTLRAHLEAVTVDVLSAPVYYWRERESGDSITQQVFKYDNLLDRVESAGMVLDMLPGHPEAVQKATRLMLAESDYIALVQAFANAPDDQVEPILDLSLDFMDRLGPEALAPRSRYDKIQYEALLHRDVPLLRELARFRADGGLRGGLRAVNVRGSRYEYPYPGHGRTDMPADLYLSPAQDVGLRTAVDSVEVADDGAVTVTGVCEIRHLPTDASRSSMSVWIVNPHRRLQVPVTRFDAVDSHGEYRRVGFTFTVDASLVRTFAADENAPAKFDVSFSTSGKTRTGLLRGLRPGSPTYPRSVRLDEQILRVNAVQGAFALTFAQGEDVWDLEDAWADGDVVHVVARASRAVQIASIVLPSTPFSRELSYPARATIESGTTRIEADLPLADVLERTQDEDPYLAASTRSLLVRAGGTRHPLRWSARARTVGAGVAGHVFRLTRAANDLAVLRETITRLTADEVRLDGEHLVVSGRDWTGAGDLELTWRRFLPGTDTSAPLTGELRRDGDAWEFTVPVAAMLDVPAHDRRVDPLEPEADWTLFVMSRSLHLDTSVMGEPFSIAALPVQFRGRRAGEPMLGTVRTHAETLHAEVRSLAAVPRTDLESECR